MYIAAGQIIEQVTGDSWDEFIAERILEPLDMDDSNTSVSALESRSNVARPHARIEQEITPVPYRNIDNAAAAGAINSSARDMANWIRFQLACGEFEDERLISVSAFNQTHEPHTVVQGGRITRFIPDAHFTIYGLGWFLHDFRGEKVVQHGGNIDGMSALVAMIPDEDLGVVVLTNMNGSLLPAAIAYTTFDAYLQPAEPKDWFEDFRKTRDVGLETQQTAEQAQEEQRIEGTSPSLAPEEYAGTFEHDMYGEAIVTFEDGTLRLERGPTFAGELEHWHYDTFRLTFDQPMLGKGMVTFHLGPDGTLDKVEIFGMDEFDYVPEPVTVDDALTLSAEEQAEFTGTYESVSPPIVLTVERFERQLRASLPGQPTFRMAPTGEDEFTLEGLPPQITVVMAFERGDDGAVTGVAMTQTPGGTFELQRKD